MYINSYLVNLTYFLLSISFKKIVNINNKMFYLIIRAGCEGSDHCRKELHNPLMRVMYFYEMSTPSYPAKITKESIYCLNNSGSSLGPTQKTTHWANTENMIIYTKTMLHIKTTS